MDETRALPPELAEVAGFLAAHPPFDALEPALLEATARAVEVAFAPKGRVLLEIGGDNRELAVIRRGAVEVHDRDGRLVARLAEGESYGLPSLLTGRPVRHRVTMIEDGLLYLLPRERFERLRRESPALDRFYLRSLDERLRAAAEREPANPLLATPVGQLATRVPVAVDASTSIAEAARRMSAEGISSLLVEQGGRLAGILTDRDLRNRVLAAAVSPQRPVAEVMTREPLTLPADRPVFEAVLAMVGRGIHHLPLVDDGRPVGMVTTRDLMTLHTRHPLYLVRQVRRQADLEGLRALAAGLPQAFVALVESGARAEDVGRMLSTIADAFAARLIELGRERLGPAPARFAWLAFGSQARREQGLASDQDNGIVYEDDAGESARDWFLELGAFVCDGLDACGWMHCPGGIMASRPACCRPLSDWRRAFDAWIDTPDPQALLNASIFFDQRLVAGDAALFEQLQAPLFDRVRGAGLMLGILAGHAQEYEVPLGLFRRFVVEREGEHRDAVDLKRHGLLPLNDLVRVRALAAGVAEAPTLERLDRLGRCGAMPPDDARRLADAQRLLQGLRTRGQAAAVRAGHRASNWLAPAALAHGEREALRDAFGVVRDAQRVLAAEFGSRA